MKIRFHCPGCKKTITGKEKHAGRTISCPGCKTSFTVPDLETFQKPDEPAEEIIEATEVMGSANQGMHTPGTLDEIPGDGPRHASESKPPEHTAATVKTKVPKFDGAVPVDSRPDVGSFACRLAGQSGASNPGRIPWNPLRYAIRNPLVPFLWLLTFVALVGWLYVNEKPKQAYTRSQPSVSTIDPSGQTADSPAARRNQFDQMVGRTSNQSAPIGSARVEKEPFLDEATKQRLGRYGTAVGLFFGVGVIFCLNKFRHFMRGDANPGVVIALNPTLVAVAADLSMHGDEKLAAKVLTTKVTHSQGAPLEIGSVVGTVAQYSIGAFGSQEQFAEFSPILANEATGNQSHLASLIGSFDETLYEQNSRAISLLPQPYQPGLYYLWSDETNEVGRRIPTGFLAGTISALSGLFGNKK